eukprot:s311_g10.t1
MEEFGLVQLHGYMSGLLTCFLADEQPETTELNTLLCKGTLRLACSLMWTVLRICLRSALSYPMEDVAKQTDPNLALGLEACENPKPGGRWSLARWLLSPLEA